MEISTGEWRPYGEPRPSLSVERLSLVFLGLYLFAFAAVV